MVHHWFCGLGRNRTQGLGYAVSLVAYDGGHPLTLGVGVTSNWVGELPSTYCVSYAGCAARARCLKQDF